MSEPIDLNDLPRWSPWPSRLLGLEPWVVPTRDIAKIALEYDSDKYARCLAHLQETPHASPEELKSYEIGLPADHPICVSRHGLLRVLPIREAWGEYCGMLAAELTADLEQFPRLVEFGSGYGYNGWLLRKTRPSLRYIGGEFSTNAVRVAEHLFAGAPAIRVVPFNFYAPESYNLLDQFEERAVVLTCGAVEQLPESGVVLENLRRHRDRVACVWHFEPVTELHGGDFLGLMRRRYTQLNDYNRDLLTQLRAARDIRITRQEADWYGMPPLNPTAVLRWEFV